MSFKQDGRNKTLSSFLIAINRREMIFTKIKMNRIQEQRP